MYVRYPYLWATSELLSHLTEAVSSPPNTPQNLRIPVKLRPEPRRQPYRSSAASYDTSPKRFQRRLASSALNYRGIIKELLLLKKLEEILYLVLAMS